MSETQEEVISTEPGVVIPEPVAAIQDHGAVKALNYLQGENDRLREELFNMQGQHYADFQEAMTLLKRFVSLVKANLSTPDRYAEEITEAEDFIQQRFVQ